MKPHDSDCGHLTVRSYLLLNIEKIAKTEENSEENWPNFPFSLAIMLMYFLNVTLIVKSVFFLRKMLMWSCGQ